MKSSKLRCHDVGLACWLLGSRSPGQVAHATPLLGHLFGHLAVMEAMKGRYNRCEADHIHFYRDSAGNEVDLLLPEERQMRVIEIKAGVTVNQDHFLGLATFARALPDQLPAGWVGYGDDAGQTRSNWPVLACHELMSKPLEVIR